MLNDAIVSIDVGQNLVVIKTVTGMAMGVATALDALKWPEILGCIAGDEHHQCAWQKHRAGRRRYGEAWRYFEQKIKRDDLAKRVWNVSAKNKSGRNFLLDCCLKKHYLKQRRRLFLRVWLWQHNMSES